MKHILITWFLWFLCSTNLVSSHFFEDTYHLWWRRVIHLLWYKSRRKLSEYRGFFRFNKKILPKYYIRNTELKQTYLRVEKCLNEKNKIIVQLEKKDVISQSMQKMRWFIKILWDREKKLATKDSIKKSSLLYSMFFKGVGNSLISGRKQLSYASFAPFDICEVLNKWQWHPQRELNSRREALETSALPLSYGDRYFVTSYIYRYIYSISSRDLFNSILYTYIYAWKVKLLAMSCIYMLYYVYLICSWKLFYTLYIYMSTISQWSTFEAIFGSASNFIKNNWKNVLLLWIILWCLSAILWWFMINMMDSLGLIEMVNSLQATLLTGAAQDPVVLEWLADQLMSKVLPYLEANGVYILLASLWMLVIGTLIEIYYGYMYFESEGVMQVSEDKVSNAFKQIVPYILTNLIYGILLLIGFMLLVIPWIIMLVYRGFVKYVMIKEKKYFFSAIWRSFDIVKGRRWKTFWYMLIIGIIISIVSSILNQVIFLAVWWMSDLVISNGISTIFSTLIGLFLSSVSFAFFLRWDQTMTANTDDNVIEVE